MTQLMQMFDILYQKKDARSSRAYPKDAIQISGEEMEEEEEMVDEELDDVEEVAREEMEEVEEMVDEELDDVEEVAGEEMEEEMVDDAIDDIRGCVKAVSRRFVSYSCSPL